MNEFAQHLCDVFRRLGPIEVKRMFGGYGVYRDGVMFALVAYDLLYLRSDAESAPRFESLGLPPFQFERKGRPTAITSYRQAPESVFEDQDAALEWGRLALAAALRARAKPRAAKAAPSAKDKHVPGKRIFLQHRLNNRT